MAEKKKLNPFYFPLIVVGVAFCVTATAFGLMTLRGVRASQSVAQNLADSESSGPHPLMTLMEEQGMTIIMVELVLLAIFTFGAIGLDQHWLNQESRAAEALTAQQKNSSGAAAESESEPDVDEEQGVTTT